MKRKLSNLQKGFTLIELLVVIAILGVLAAGVFTAINPIQRINQANDSKVKNDIGQIAQAEQGYFTTNQVYLGTVAGLVTAGDLKSEPKDPNSSPANGIYVVTCNAADPCTEISIFGNIKAPKTAGNTGWCFKSATGQSTEVVDAAACTP